VDILIFLDPDVISFSYLSLFVILINIVTAIHILLNKHDEPVSAIVWLLTVTFLPAIGLFLYLFFGINRSKLRTLDIEIANQLILEAREKIEYKNSQNKTQHSPKNKNLQSTISHYLHQQHFFTYKNKENECYPAYCKMLDRLLPNTTPLYGNHVKLLLDGSQAYPKMIEAIEDAKHSIHLQSYIIMNDKIGKSIFNILKKRAKEGVKVKVLYDRFGSWTAFASSFITRFFTNSENFEILPFTQFRPWSVQLRNHRKLMVVDGKHAFIGGINISEDNYAKTAKKERYIHDLHCSVIGPVVGELQFSFLKDWHCISKMPPIELLKDEYFPPLSIKGDSIARLIGSGPGQEYKATDKVHMTAITTAQKYVWIMSPYFVPDKSFCKLLIAAAGRDLDIKIIVPEKNNHWYIQLATHSLYRTLLESGIRIFEKQGVFSHAKAILVDGEWAKMGSSNCDVRSFKLNYELDFILEKGDFLKELHDQFIKEILNSNEIQLEDVLNKGLPLQLCENICALFTPVL